MEDVLNMDKEMENLSKDLTDIRFYGQRLAQISSQVDEIISIHKTNIAVVLVTIASSFSACAGMFTSVRKIHHPKVNLESFSMGTDLLPYLALFSLCFMILFWGCKNKYGDVISALINLVAILLAVLYIYGFAGYYSCGGSIFAIFVSWIHVIFRSYKLRKKVWNISITQAGEQV